VKTMDVGLVLSHIRLCTICRQPWGMEGVENLEVVLYKQFLGDCHGGIHYLHQLDGLPNQQKQQWLAPFEYIGLTTGQ
jgi:hypothetical protein